jgi:hypothetical protein
VYEYDGMNIHDALGNYCNVVLIPILAQQNLFSYKWVDRSRQLEYKANTLMYMRVSSDT